MICYKLHCENGHNFEGWFPSSESCAQQVKAALVSCPECGSCDVSKALMAPAVARAQAQARHDGHEAVATHRSNDTKPLVSPNMSQKDLVRVAFRQLQAVVKAHCENVDSRFADEAIKRHRLQEAGQMVSGGIYGSASPEDRARLEEEGVEFLTIPWERTDDA